MLKKLRWKFVLVNMTIVMVMMLFIFGILYISTAGSLERESLQMLGTIAMNPVRPEFLTGFDEDEEIEEPDKQNEVSRDVRLPYFTVMIDRSGKTTKMGGGFFDLSDEAQVDTLVQETLETGKQTGVLKDYNLRFLLIDNPMGENISFADITSEQATLRNLIKSLALIGVAAFLGFFMISILLARWAVKPVEHAWQQQKQFIADASHELKTPLTVIMTDAELLNGNVSTEKERELLVGSIQTMSGQMKGLVESMLELARLDNSDLNKQKEDVDFSEVTADSSMIFEPVLFEKDLIFVYEIEPDIKVSGNATNLKQLVDIFLDNAGKYTSPFGEVRLELKKTSHKKCLLTVANQGTPISDEEKEHLFERFYRADKARTRNQSYGLGLAIAKSVADDHGGKVWVESKDGFNTFCVEFTMQTV